MHLFVPRSVPEVENTVVKEVDVVTPSTELSSVFSVKFVTSPNLIASMDKSFGLLRSVSTMAWSPKTSYPNHPG